MVLGAAVSFPIMFLNLLGGIVSGIWLGVLGMWSVILAGIVGFIFGPSVLAFALIPGLALLLPAGVFHNRGSLSGAFVFAFGSSAYIYSILAAWCMSVMWFFLGQATEGSVFPVLLWSYGVAICPICFMATRGETDHGSAMMVFFSELAYISAGIWVLAGDPSVKDLGTLMACVMSVGLIVAWVHSAMKFAGDGSMSKR